MIKNALAKKSSILQNGHLSLNTDCQDQVTRSNHHKVFNGVTLGVNNDPIIGNITNEDISAGFMVYSVLVYCQSEVLALHQFLQSLLSTQTTRTIIKVSVNTIQETNFKRRETRNRMNQFYLALDKSLDLNFGKILLATSSPRQLEDLIAKDMPYFNTSQVEDCLHGDSCQEVRNLVQSLGNNIT